MGDRARWTQNLALGAFFLSGAAALAYEVVWTRALSVVLGSTTYALSTMLATFMLGLALGGLAGGRIADRIPLPLKSFGYCELGIGLAGLASVPLIFSLPGVYLAIYRHFHLYPVLFFLLQILLCALVMLLPTVLMGMTFPLVSRGITSDAAEVGRRVGFAYFANTAGAVAGTLVTGFVLIPHAGLGRSAAAAGAINLAAGCAILAHQRGFGIRSAVLVALYVPALGLAVWTRPDWSLVNFYSAHRYLEGERFSDIQAKGRASLALLHDREYAESNVKAFATVEGHLLLQVGGKLEGTGPADVDNALLLAYLPAASHRDPRSILVIGLGAGVTLAAAKQEIPSVDLVEINSGVLEAVKRFGRRGLFDGVRVFRDDARNHLLKGEKLYDVISSEPSYPTDFAVANLYTLEYFQLAARRLHPGGVYCQWLPYHMLTNDDVTLLAATFARVFPYARLWKMPRSLDLILVGSLAPQAVAAEEIEGRVARMNAPGRPLEFVLSRDEGQIASIAAGFRGPLNRDDRPLLEFAVARNLRVGDLSLLEAPVP